MINHRPDAAETPVEALDPHEGRACKAFAATPQTIKLDAVLKAFDRVGYGPLKMVDIHTDGACRGNPGPGGFGVVLVSGKHRLELSQGFVKTTNNRMELFAAIAALESLTRPCSVRLWSDSRYLVDAMTKGWLKGWKRNGWVTSNRQPVKNQDLWERLERAIENHEIKWRWLRGHAGHKENERCDELAVAASKARSLLQDEGFEVG